MSRDNVVWGNPGALGLAAFGFSTLLLQIHNIGLISSTMPIIWGFAWGGTAQVIAGIIDARRGDTFGFTAFTSFGVFWIGLAFAFLLEWLGIITLEGPGLAWTMITWGIFAGYMTIGACKISRVHVTIFASLTVLFALLAGHFYGIIPVRVAGIEGIFVAGSAIYGSAAVLVHAQFRRWVFPIGLFPAVSKVLPRALPAKATMTKLDEQLEEIFSGITTTDEIAEVERAISEVKGKILAEPGQSFWEGKKPCWEMLRCPEEIRSECPAFKHQGLPCWQIEGTYAKLHDNAQRGCNTDICRVCRVYKRWGQDEPIEIKLHGRGIHNQRFNQPGSPGTQ